MYNCEVCEVEIESAGMCDTCSMFIGGIEKSNECELVYLRKTLDKLKKQLRQISKERDILVHRVLRLDHAYCPHTTEEMSNIPKDHPELVKHCKEMVTCHNCWYEWVRKEAESCNKRICIHCQHSCVINQKMERKL